MEIVRGPLWPSYAVVVLAILLGLPGGLQDALAIPGTFLSNQQLKNKKLPLPAVLTVRASSDKFCEEKCSKHPECDAFARSSLSKMCLMYKVVPGTPPVRDSEYNLFVRQKTVADGYHAYKTDYLKLNFTRMTAEKAQKQCETENGQLAAIWEQPMNDLARDVLNSHVVFRAFVGIKYDEGGQWMRSDGLPSTYDQWMYNAPRADKILGCTVINIDGSWKEVPCAYKAPFFCQIPMF